MKKIFILAIATILALNLSAQDGKQARKDIKSGNKAFREQLYGTAESAYADAITADPGSIIASYNLATTYYKEQRWDDALKEYQRYLSLDNTDHLRMSNVWSNIGNTYLHKKGDEPAQNRAKQNAQMQSGQAPDKEQEQEKKEDNLKLSIEAYKNALRLNPKDDDTRYNLAVAQKILKDQQKDGGGQDNKQDQQQDKKDDQKKDQQQDQNQDKNDQKKNPQQGEGQMSQENMQQILQALEQEEKQTQERVQQVKEQDRKRQNANNKRQNKDW